MSEANADARKDATAATRAAHEAVARTLPPDDGAFELARRGFIGSIPDADVPGAWSQRPFAFLDAERPDTINPSLWRQARLNALHGLFEVTPGVYQVRGFDISNITFVEGREGWIVIDPLTSAQPAAAALQLLRDTKGDRPVTAVIYTHSHVDHYGGVMGVLSPDDIARGVPIVAPEGFLQAAVAENVLAGNVMSRRATYMYGGLLPKDPRGHVDSGLGKGTSTGKVALVAPNVSVTHTGQVLTLDGVEIVFQVTPDTEAPAEMNFHFPQFGALCMAENCTCHLHNLYTPRGAQVRDAKAWSFYIDEALDMFAGASDVMFASHHWPRWGEDPIRAFLAKQRDLYKYIHDQTLRMANHGMNGPEIAEVLRLPPTLEAEWHTRSYYGTLSHNAKAVYQKYLGWFDGNPANLNKHPPEAAGRRYVDAMGGPDRVLAEGRRAFEAGDYRWTAEIVGHLVFADPAHEAARALQADALEQMGYQAESGPWRDFYLTGAQELRKPRPKSDTPRQASAGQLRTLPADNLLDALSVRLNGLAAGAETIGLTVAFTDTGERFAVRVENAVLHHRAGEGGPAAELSRGDLVDLVTGAKTVAEAGVAGDGAAELARLVSLLDRFDLWFEITAP
ncbi:MAG: MBL fold metallo-hydrolase [Phenylobacterium sp.]|uniref:alkyl/aryl-sulfatase n=1 Tax=Phenylobacterium sp. TaxID=1871053 RepID=UPI001A3F29C2|nr:alkyl sulfatase dimerization domain-containing protein [Phenylobacterium sp.]MBL8772047.1 MBL fold metallo-hydrolase [Phenylobacterium sp.]